MNHLFRFLVEHPYPVLCAWVLADQLGLPMPSIPLLLAAGALVGRRQMNVGMVMGLTTIAAVTADVIWFAIGRLRGAKVLQFLCRISLEPDSCVRRTETMFASRGARALLFAKFVPGLGTAAPPLAGMIGMKLRKFVVWDMAGAMLWAGGFIGLGLAFSRQLNRVGEYASRLGAGLVVLLAGGLALYIVWKYVQRRRFLRSLRIARISPEELKDKLDRGDDVTIVDLRHSLDFEADPSHIPGALRLSAENFEARHKEIPRDREIILYCT